MREIGIESFEEWLIAGSRWMDVRSPLEFAEGAIPMAVNLPLMNDNERHLVGLKYKTFGQDAAIELGYQLVSGDLRQQRLQQWENELRQFPEAIIYCFRGGLRSRTVQKWLAEKGYDCPLVKGGYKALRNFLMQIIATRLPQMDFIVVSGHTGSGKTTYLKTSGKPYLDLEELACHRGSAFGAMENPQPNQVNFENRLAVEILKLAQLQTSVLVESESRLIGHRVLPEVLLNKIKTSPRLELNIDLATRVENIFQEYVVQSSLGQKGDLLRFDEFRKAVFGISKKLGGARAQEILGDLQMAQENFLAGKGLGANRIWIEKLLLWYYDPRYQHASATRFKDQ